MGRQRLGHYCWPTAVPHKSLRGLGSAGCSLHYGSPSVQANETRREELSEDLGE